MASVAPKNLGMSEETAQKEIVPPEKWLELYGDYLFRYALLRLRNRAAAEDAVQDTLLAGIKGFERFDGRVEVKYWLRGILRNKIVDSIRASVKQSNITEREREQIDPPENWLFKYAGIPGREPASWGFDPSAAFQQEEFWKVFHSCVSKLGSRQRQAFILRELEDVSSEEVCKLMDISPNNLWVIIHRARKQLKLCLQKNWSDQK